MNLINVISSVLEPKWSLPADRRRFSNRDSFRLILPILMEQLLTMLVGIADTLMVSYAGDAAVSGVSLVNQLNNIFIFIFGAEAPGGAVVASQYVGRRDQENGVDAASQLVLFGLWLHLDVTGIAYAMVGDWLIKAILIVVRYRSRKWTQFEVI